MPFGLCNALATFQRLMALIFAGLVGLECLIYLDDIIIFCPIFDVYLLRLKHVFIRLQENNLKIKIQKCHFKFIHVSFLRHVVSGDGIQTNSAKISSIATWQLPPNISQLQSFPGVASYYLRFIKYFGKIALPMTALLEKDKAFIWTDEGKRAFTEIKNFFH